MELFEQVQFESLLMDAAGRFNERLTQKSLGHQNALLKLGDPQDSQIDKMLTEFIDALFKESLLDNVSGYCFLIGAMHGQGIELEENTWKVSSLLAHVATECFKQLLRQKAHEFLELQIAYGFEMGTHEFNG